VLLRGLSADPTVAAPLPVPALGPEELDAVMSSGALGRR